MENENPAAFAPDYTLTVAEMRTILEEEVPKELGGKVVYSEPKNAVDVYRINYNSIVPEQSNRPTLASGLLAIPATGAPTMPLISYQHGTLYGDMAPPSDYMRSFEARLMVSQFASNGYAVICADYFGFGVSKEKDSYIVLNSQVQAAYDFYRTALMLLAQKGIGVNHFFSSGWSQGGVITMAFLERLENLGVPVTAVGTAAAQCDGFVMTNGFLSHPRAIDAPWVTTMFILTAFAFEEYYQIPDLARGLFTDNQYDLALRVYNKDNSLDEKDFPLELQKLIRPEYFNPTYFAQSAYGKLLLDMHPYRWDIKTPVRMYYGDVGDCLSSGLARLPIEWQNAMGNTKVEAISVGADGTHRLAFGRAVPEWKAWFDSMLC